MGHFTEEEISKDVKRCSTSRAFKEKKIAELTDWAKNYTDVKTEEIPEFVERVYNKRYGKSLA